METTLDAIRGARLCQPKDGYRFSLDAPLLSSFVNLKHVCEIADLGAGCGVVGILLAQKYPGASVTLVEIQDALYRLSIKNIGLNGLKDRVTAVKADLGSINAEDSPLLTLESSFGLVVSNPPFRKPESGKLSKEDGRLIARHEVKLTLPALARAAAFLLKPKGRFMLIYLPERLAELFSELRACGLEPKRMRLVHSRVDGGAKMALVEAVKAGRAGMKIEKPLFVYAEGATYSKEVREITTGA